MYDCPHGLTSDTELFHCLCFDVAPSRSSPSTSEHGGQRSHLNHLLPPVQSDAIGQTAEQGRRHQDTAVDLHQVLSGETVTYAASRHGS